MVDMVDHDIILAKATSFIRHLRRIEEKANLDVASFLKNTDAQDVVLYNIQSEI
jgi:hypothetical protein